jgi:hypothetical protein
MEEDLIIEMWDVFKEYIPEKNRETAANHYVDFLVGKDVDVFVLEGIMGYDTHLDQAIKMVIEENSEESFDEDGDVWKDNDDEDY